MNNTLTVETPIIFKHTLNLNDYPEFNQMSEEVIKTFLTGMVVAVFELKEMEKKVNKYNNGSYGEVIVYWVTIYLLSWLAGISISP
jgi:hypothetical protein